MATTWKYKTLETQENHHIYGKKTLNKNFGSATILNVVANLKFNIDDSGKCAILLCKKKRMVMPHENLHGDASVLLSL
jgi:hypothetical protein